MKLKLDPTPNVLFLQITETVDLNQLTILRAGLAKILPTAKKPVILDLMPIAPADSDSRAFLLAAGSLMSWANQQGSKLLIVGPWPEEGHFPTRELAAEALSKPCGEMVIRERTIKDRVADLEYRKSQLETMLAERASKNTDLRTLKAKFSTLSMQVTELDSQVHAYWDNRKPPADDSPRLASVAQILTLVLEQEGILK